MKYEVVPAVVWRNQRTGGAASTHGAVPWRSEAEACEWKIEHKGFTVYNPLTNEYGIGRIPWPTQEEAQAFVDKHTPSRCRIGD
jgi:hypothetical protein